MAGLELYEILTEPRRLKSHVLSAKPQNESVKPVNVCGSADKATCRFGEEADDGWFESGQIVVKVFKVCHFHHYISCR